MYDAAGIARNATAVATTIAAGKSQPESGLYVGLTQAAVYDAVINSPDPGRALRLTLLITGVSVVALWSVQGWLRPGRSRS